MCLEKATHGVRSCRSSPVGWDLAGQGGVRNTPSPAERHPPASLWMPVCRRGVKANFRALQTPIAPFLRYWTWFYLPDVARVFSNGAVARKLSGARNVQNRFPGPLGRICIERADRFLCPAIRRQVRQMHVVVAVRQEGIAQRSENSWFVPAEIVGEDKIQCCSRFVLVLIVPMRVIRTTAVLDLVHREAE